MMFILVIAFAVVFWLAFWWADRNGGDLVPFSLLAFAVTFSLAAFILPVVAVTNRMGFGGELAAIEQSRHAAATLHGVNASQVYGDAVGVNQQIALNQWYRHQWWARDFVSPAWEAVGAIALPDTIGGKP